jgi:hypothetical protein
MYQADSWVGDRVGIWVASGVEVAVAVAVRVEGKVSVGEGPGVAMGWQAVVIYTVKVIRNVINTRGATAWAQSHQFFREI